MSLIFKLGAPPQHQVSPPRCLPDLMESASRRSKPAHSHGTQSINTAFKWMLHITSVCSTWRNIALSDQSLWCQITILSSTEPAALAYNIMRTGSLPLSLVLVFGEDERVPPFTVTGELYQCSDLHGALTSIHALDLLKPHASRFRELSVKTSCRDDMSFVLNTLSTFSAASCLERLIMVDIGECRYQTHSDDNQTTVLFSDDLPNLKSTVLFGIPITVCRNLDIQTSLSELYVSCDVFDEHDLTFELNSILRSCQSLSSLRISSYGLIRPIHIPVPLLLPSITQLDLQFWNGDYLANLIEVLLLPNIDYLSIDIGFGTFSDLCQKLSSPSSNITSVLSTVRTLCIRQLPVGRKTMEDLFMSLASLEVLIIGNQPAAQTILVTKILSLPYGYDDDNSPDMYCPNLLHVYWKYAAVSDLKKFARARKKFQHPIPVLHVSDACDVSKRDLRFLRKQDCSLEIHELLDFIY